MLRTPGSRLIKRLKKPPWSQGWPTTVKTSNSSWSCFPRQRGDSMAQIPWHTLLRYSPMHGRYFGPQKRLPSILVARSNAKWHDLIVTNPLAKGWDLSRDIRQPAKKIYPPSRTQWCNIHQTCSNCKNRRNFSSCLSVQQYSILHALQ